MKHFSVEFGPQTVPAEWTDAPSRLLKVSWKGRPVTGISQAAFRSYVYPVVTPAGVEVTTESPTDHAWHQSVTIGTDHFYTYVGDTSARVEEPPSNFYWDWKFQGRDAGRIVSRAVNECTELADDHLQITQRLWWEGPEQWGSPPYRRIVAEEVRTIDVFPGERANVIDVRTVLRPTQWDLRIGPCRHGYFTIRVADHLRAADKSGGKLSGRLVDSDGRVGADRIGWQHADWIDYSGEDDNGRIAGLAMFQFPSLGNVPWYVVDYGSVRINPFRLAAKELRRGEKVDVAIRLIAHDGDQEHADVPGLYREFTRT